VHWWGDLHISLGAKCHSLNGCRESWVPLIGYSPELLTLPRGWFGFVFKNPEDSAFILGRFWDFEGGSLMLKRWRIRFDPTTEYFSFRHLGTTSGLPLQLWNAKALEAIGNVLGRFIKVDEVALHSQDKRMERVLVEVDIHAGLLESLEIDWRGHIIVQRLDYLGIPFRCTLCRRTGHLRKDCQPTFGVSDSEDSMEDMSKDLYMNEADSQGDGGVCCSERERKSRIPNDTFVGKLKLHCPSLYFSLTAWERDHLDNTFLPDLISSPVIDSGTSLRLNQWERP
jgi:hypothetical protein